MPPVFKEMNAPSFRVEMADDGKMLLHYYSDRKGLYHIVPGKNKPTYWLPKSNALILIFILPIFVFFKRKWIDMYRTNSYLYRLIKVIE